MKFPNPLLRVVYYGECEEKPTFLRMLKGATGYVAVDGTMVLYGSRHLDKGIEVRRHNHRRGINGDTIPAPVLRFKRECAICGQRSNLTRHHLTPREIVETGKSTHKGTVLVCQPCHVELHRRFTNEQLAELSWDEVVNELRKTVPSHADRVVNS